MNQTSFNYSSLLSSDCSETTQELREWLAAGGDVNQTFQDSGDSTDYEHATLLHGALFYHHFERIDVLLGAGANTNIPERRFGMTALHVACQMRGGSGLVQRLLDNGADATITTVDGYTPLDIAVANGKADAVEALIRHGVDTATAFRCFRIRQIGDCGEDVKLQDDQVMALLLAAGADINTNTSRDGETNTLLNMALDFGAMESARFLLAHGAQPVLGSLHIAARKGCVKTIKALLNAGEDVHALFNGQTALRDAMIGETMGTGNGNPRAVQALLDAGANPNADGAMIGAKPGRAGADMLKALISAGGDINAELAYYEDRKSVPLAIYAARGNASAVQVLLDAGADLVVNGTPIESIIKDLDGRVAVYGPPEAAMAVIEAHILRQTFEQIEQQQAPVASLGRARL